MYITPKNEIFARHLLATRRQQAGESLDEFLNVLKRLSKDCNFKAVSAENYQKEMIRDAYINGLLSQHIRQRLLENTTLDLDAAYRQARSLESAQRNSDVYSTQGTHSLNTIASSPDVSSIFNTPAVNAVNKTRKCYFCGNNIHNRQNCPARDCTCNKCGKIGHFAKVCQSKSKSSQTASVCPVADTPPSATSVYPTLATISAASPQGLQKSVVKIEVNEHSVEALIDTGSTDSFMSQKLASKLQLSVSPVTSVVTMADSSLQVKVVGYSIVNLKIADNYFYENVKLSILEKPCSEVLIGLNILQQRKSLNLHFGGPKPTLSICALSRLSILSPSPFANLTPDIKPTATKSRKYSSTDRTFIESEVQRLLREGIIEPSNFPWRAQVLVTTNENHRKRMVIDYSETIDLCTQLDAYPFLK